MEQDATRETGQKVFAVTFSAGLLGLGFIDSIGGGPSWIGRLGGVRNGMHLRHGADFFALFNTP